MAISNIIIVLIGFAPFYLVNFGHVTVKKLLISVSIFDVWSAKIRRISFPLLSLRTSNFEVKTRPGMSNSTRTLESKATPFIEKQCASTDRYGRERERKIILALNIC